MPGLVWPVTRIRPIATSTPTALVAPVQVSCSLPSLARTRETELPLTFATQISAPSDLRSTGLLPTVVRPRTVEFCVVQNWSKAARRLPRSSTRSTVRERKAAICSRVTGLVGS